MEVLPQKPAAGGVDPHMLTGQHRKGGHQTVESIPKRNQRRQREKQGNKRLANPDCRRALATKIMISPKTEIKNIFY